MAKPEKKAELDKEGIRLTAQDKKEQTVYNYQHQT
jgi:hypothetical protein